MYDITVVCIDGTINSNRCKLLAEEVANRLKVKYIYFNGVCSSIRDYNLQIASLNDHIKTEHCLVIQYDGYPLDYNSWNDEFLHCDYIGAPWYNQPWPLDLTVGNGGFSLRSKKFLEECSKLSYDGTQPEDVFFCRTNGRYLRSKGIKFAKHDLAYMFSVEDMPYKGQFGFHGKNTIAINKHFGIF
jgi:hypothetical protein